MQKSGRAEAPCKLLSRCDGNVNGSLTELAVAAFRQLLNGISNLAAFCSFRIGSHSETKLIQRWHLTMPDATSFLNQSCGRGMWACKSAKKLGSRCPLPGVDSASFTFAQASEYFPSANKVIAQFFKFLPF